LIQIKTHQKVAICSLNNGVTNAINADMIQRIGDTLDEFENNQEINGVLITSSNSKFYSIGLDIPELFNLLPEEFTEFFQDFSQLCVKILSFPKPVIAAINGHTIAGGCILVLACDYRLAKESEFKMGLNEIQLGVPVPYIAECILKDLVGTRLTRYICETGDFFSPPKLLELGLIDEIIDEKILHDSAITKINTIANHSLEAYSRIKEIRNEMILERFRQRYQKTTNEFVELWYSTRTRGKLEKAMEKF
jgi:enoyl-CoA hydratase/carnithine racemase